MADEQLKLDELTREQILDLADAAGRKLGFLLATSGLDDDVKEAIIGILDQATPEQLDILTNMFEEGYLRVQNKDLDEFLRNELENVKAEYEVKRAALEKDVLDKLDKLIK
ncbi:MAG: hypothetical protein AAB906_02960 [Patescibacteria group bacterium]